MPETKKNESRGTERPTLRTIAKITGLAVTTVSRALNDAPDIGKATKQRVKQVADEIGYLPNRAGVRLRTGKTNVIALVLYTYEDVLSFTSNLIYSISEGLEGTPYHLIVRPYSNADDQMDPIRYIVETGSADGIVINRVQPNDPRVRYMLDRDFPFVTHGRTHAGWDHAYFDYDNQEFGYHTVKTLAERGRRNIGMLFPPDSQSYGQHMIQGAKEAAEEHGVKLRLVEQVTSEARFPDVTDAIERVFRDRAHPDSLVVASSSAAMVSIAAIEKVGLTIGQDVMIATKDTSSFLSYFRDDIIVFREDVGRAGDFIARALLQRMKSPKDKPMQALESPLDYPT